MAEVKAEALKAAKTAFEDRFLANSNNRILEGKDAKEVANKASQVGQQNATALMDGEFAEFMTAKDYEEKANDYIINTATTSSTTGRDFERVYALVNRFFVVNGKRVGEHLDFIDVGGMVRRHYDTAGKQPDADGKIAGAVRVVTPGTFNEKLNSFHKPWIMLTQYLAGKVVGAKRSTDKKMFQKFVGGRPVTDEYVEQFYNIYDFAKA